MYIDLAARRFRIVGSPSEPLKSRKGKRRQLLLPEEEATSCSRVMPDLQLDCSTWAPFSYPLTCAVVTVRGMYTTYVCTYNFRTQGPWHLTTRRAVAIDNLEQSVPCVHWLAYIVSSVDARWNFMHACLYELIFLTSPGIVQNQVGDVILNFCIMLV